MAVAQPADSVPESSGSPAPVKTKKEKKLREAPEDTAVAEKREKKKSRKPKQHTVAAEVLDDEDGLAAEKKHKHKKSQPVDTAAETLVEDPVPAQPEDSKERRRKDKKKKHRVEEEEAAEEGEEVAVESKPKEKKHKKSKAVTEEDGKPKRHSKRKAVEDDDATRAADTTSEASKAGHREKKKRKHSTSEYPDPTEDEELSDQARKALSYAYEYAETHEEWKFNKARQNWLMRNVWSDALVPEKYVSLVNKYLSGLQGGAKEAFVKTCQSHAAATETAETADATTPDSVAVTKRQRAQILLELLGGE